MINRFNYDIFNLREYINSHFLLIDSIVIIVHLDTFFVDEIVNLYDSLEKGHNCWKFSLPYNYNRIISYSLNFFKIFFTELFIWIIKFHFWSTFTSLLGQLWARRDLNPWHCSVPIRYSITTFPNFFLKWERRQYTWIVLFKWLYIYIEAIWGEFTFEFMSLWP